MTFRTTKTYFFREWKFATNYLVTVTGYSILVFLISAIIYLLQFTLV